MPQHPLGHNYHWVVHKDHHFVPRELTADLHDVLTTVVVAQDRHLSRIEQTLGHRVVLAVRLGMRTVHIRVYDLENTRKNTIDLPSRLGSPDSDTYVIFNPAGGVEVVHGLIRERARGQMPVFYAHRTLSPNQASDLDRLQTQFCGRVSKHLGQPRPTPPLEEWEVVDMREPPTLEPETPISN